MTLKGNPLIPPHSRDLEWDLCVVGSIVMDSCYLANELPVLGGEVRANSYDEHHGGACGNVAAYSAFTFKLRTVILSSVGQDNDGTKLVDRLILLGAETSHIIREEKTGHITLLTDIHGQRIFIVYLPVRSITPIQPEVIAHSRAIYIAPCEPELADLAMKTASANKRPILFNPGSMFFSESVLPALPALLAQADLIFVNRDEAVFYSHQDAPQAAADYFLRFGAVAVIITDAANGSLIFTRNTSFYQPAYKVNVENPLGPGDAYASGFIAALLNNCPFDQAARQGSKIGAFVVTQTGTREVVPTPTEFEHFCVQLSVTPIQENGINIWPTAAECEKENSVIHGDVDEK